MAMYGSIYNWMQPTVWFQKMECETIKHGGIP